VGVLVGEKVEALGLVDSDGTEVGGIEGDELVEGSALGPLLGN
jgi:hypothetical protein